MQIDIFWYFNKLLAILMSWLTFPLKTTAIVKTYKQFHKPGIPYHRATEPKDRLLVVFRL